MKHNYKLLIFLGFIITAVISSCEIYNPAEPVPSYIHIQKFDLTTTPAYGTNSNKICDAWVYIDEQIIGCFEMPVTFPVLLEGKHHIRIKPGIKVNGIATNRSPYPFYNNYEQDIDLEKGKILTLSPATTYNSATVVAFATDFETPGTTIDTTSGRTDTTLQILYSATPSPDIFEGHYSAIAYVDPVNTRFECRTVAPMTLPTGASAVFLEFNYKCTYQFTVSVYAYGPLGTFQQFPVLHFNPSPDWNKEYVYLSPTVSGAYTAVNYRIAWGMVDNTGTSGVSLSLDNIKIIHF